MNDLLVHVSNIHCETCVSAISKTLQDVFHNSIEFSIDLALGTIRVFASSFDAFDQDFIASLVFELKKIGFSVDDIDAVPSLQAASQEQRPEQPSNPFVNKQDKEANWKDWVVLPSRVHETEGEESSSGDLSSMRSENFDAKHNSICEVCHQDSKDSASAIHVTHSVDLESKNGGGSAKKYKLSAAIDGITCAACASTIQGITEPLWFIDEVYIDVVLKTGKFILNNADPSCVAELKEAVEDAGYDFHIIEDIEDISLGNSESREQSNDKEGKEYTHHRITAMIDGITCAACVSTINGVIEQLSFVEDRSISAVSKVGVFIVKDDLQESYTHKVDILKETIEDAGYDFHILEDELLDLHMKNNHKQRTVELLIEGIHCDQCPHRVVEQLQKYGTCGEFHRLKTSSSSGTIKITYLPQVSKGITIRSIISSLEQLQLRVQIQEHETMSEHLQKMARVELRSIVMRLVFTCVFVVPTFIFGVVVMSLLPKGNFFNQVMSHRVVGNTDRTAWVLFGISTPVYFVADWPFHTKALKELFVLWKIKGQWVRKIFKFGSMNLLISLGTSVAYFASILLLIISACSVESMQMTKTYFDSVVFLTFFILIGKLLESISKSKTSSFLNELSAMKPTTAILHSASSAENNKSNANVPIQYLECGDRILIKPGESPPLDCILSQGGPTQFDESCLTGESVPQAKTLGDNLYSGTVNVGGHGVVAQVVTLDGDSLLDSIVSSIRDGQLQKRAPIEIIADKVTSFFVPCIVLLALITWIVWIVLGYCGALPRAYLHTSGATNGGWAIWSMEFAISVFVISCPCALGLSVPLALFVGTGMVAKHGILAKGGGLAFQKGSKVNVVCFDKTGTLTLGGEPKITNYCVSTGLGAPGSFEFNNVFKEIYAMEKVSNHPLSKSLVSFIEKEFSSSVESGDGDGTGEVDVCEIPGRGLQSDNLVIGNEKFMLENKCFVNSVHLAHLSTWKSEGKSIILVGKRNGRDDNKHALVAAFAARDPVRPEAKKVVALLQQRGIQCWVISGDNETTTRAIAKEVGIANVIAEVLPQGKAEKVKWIQENVKVENSGGGILSRLQKILGKMWFGIFKNNSAHGGWGASRGGSIVCMVGDGINDAPALSTADIGVAIATKTQASDLALSSCDFALLNPKETLLSLLILFDLCNKIFYRVYFNFAYAIIYNTLGVPIAAGVLFPLPSHYRLSPTWSSLIMAVSSVSVVLSSLMLKFYKPEINGEKSHWWERDKKKRKNNTSKNMEMDAQVSKTKAAIQEHFI
ncbi:hypothetical protein ACO0QE_002896 [Hanseniaspora vineae]